MKCFNSAKIQYSILAKVIFNFEETVINFKTHRRKLFGTDGIRGVANQWPIVPDALLKIAIATGHHFYKSKTGREHKPTVVIGKDTRLSGYLIESTLTAGFLSVGMDVVLLGPLPTPAVALMTRSLRADLGVMISASHNPSHDNGIKFFGADGYKLTTEQEQEIERQVLEESLDPSVLTDHSSIGKARRLDDALGRYLEFAKGTFPRELRLDGLKIVLDTANGAAYKVAPAVLWELGADVVTIGAEPNGFNINKECGATNLKKLQQTVIEQKADCGIALDGDGDRLMVIDQRGRVIDGDQILALIAKNWNKTGQLKGGGIVITQMSNLGLEKYLNSIGLNAVRTDVGDRHVASAMRERGMNVGGEQSGHIILGDYATTGDGLCSALQVLAMVVQSKQTIDQTLKVFETIPQISENINFDTYQPGANEFISELQEEVKAYTTQDMRFILRPSGTEPLVRIMAQGSDQSNLSKTIDYFAERIKSFQPNQPLVVKAI